MARPTTYDPKYADDLINRMDNGELDVEIYSSWSIKKDTFYRWRREVPEFQEAFEIGMGKCEAWWIREGKKCWMNKDKNGFNYYISIMNNKFGWGKEDARNAVTQNTQVNIYGNMNVIESKSDTELLEMLNTKLTQLRLPSVPEDVIDVQIISEDKTNE